MERRISHDILGPFIALLLCTISLVACQGDRPRPVAQIDQAAQAVVRIEAEGTFVDPEIGLITNNPGSGSGFIVDPSGATVTNYHVVAGSALLRVWVGDEELPRNAKILGVAACSDLALIDIDGDDFPFLAWSEADPQVGTQVFAAGFPLADPRLTLTRGIVSKASADGQTAWASLGEVIEHDATLNPGSSGGPLLDEGARVLGVNFASSTEALNQNFAIKTSTVLPILALLQEGQSQESIGVNGVAVNDPEAGISGIWVSSVETGSAAHLMGIAPGDIILSLEHLLLAQDGTIKEYCEVLRSHQAGQPLSITLLRPSSRQILEGILQTTPLEVVASFESEPDVASRCVGYEAWVSGLRHAIEMVFGPGGNPSVALRDGSLDDLQLRYDAPSAIDAEAYLRTVRPPPAARPAHNLFLLGFDRLALVLPFPPQAEPFLATNAELSNTIDYFDRALDRLAEAEATCKP